MLQGVIMYDIVRLILTSQALHGIFLNMSLYKLTRGRDQSQK